MPWVASTTGAQKGYVGRILFVHGALATWCTRMNQTSTDTPFKEPQFRKLVANWPMRGSLRSNGTLTDYYTKFRWHVVPAPPDAEARVPCVQSGRCRRPPRTQPRMPCRRIRFFTLCGRGWTHQWRQLQWGQQQQSAPDAIMKRRDDATAAATAARLGRRRLHPLARGHPFTEGVHTRRGGTSTFTLTAVWVAGARAVRPRL